MPNQSQNPKTLRSQTSHKKKKNTKKLPQVTVPSSNMAGKKIRSKSEMS